MYCLKLQYSLNKSNIFDIKLKNIVFWVYNMIKQQILDIMLAEIIFFLNLNNIFAMM